MKALRVGAVLLLVPLVAVLGIVVVGSKSPGLRAANCLGLTTSDAAGALAGGSILDQQISNARLIDRAVEQAGLSGQATLVALVAAVGESDLINLDHGHLDSIGLFQQRPSMGWGTIAQIMDPAYAATSFLLGPHHDGAGGLVTVADWQAMPVTAAIHAVQANADPNHYTRFEARARAIAEKAGIDLTRPGTGSSAGPVDTTTWCTAGNTGQAVLLAIGEGACPLDQHSSAAATCDQAIQFATQQMNSGSRSWYRLCLGLVSQSYGSIYAGVPTAYEGALIVQRSGGMQPATKNYTAIPRGAILWYDGRATGNTAGHVAISLGGGMAISNDVPVTDGRVGIVPISYFETTWGQTFMGWSAPVR